MLGDSCLRILTRTHLRFTSASMMLRSSSEVMIVSWQSRVGVSVSAMIKGDDCEVGVRGALLTGFQQSETLGVAMLVHDSRGYG